jgi:hypothetical protein
MREQEISLLESHTFMANIQNDRIVCPDLSLFPYSSTQIKSATLERSLMRRFSTDEAMAMTAIFSFG